MTNGSCWAIAQTVSKMEHIVRREIEKTNRGAFLPTFARRWKVDGRPFAKEYPLLGSYVFFLTEPNNYAYTGIDGVYRVLAIGRQRQAHRRRRDGTAGVGHAAGDHNRIDAAKFTKYYRPER